MEKQKDYVDAIGHKAVIFDLDGTLSDDRWRRDLVSGGDYSEYHAQCSNDTSIRLMIRRLKKYRAAGVRIIFVTGRPTSVRRFTEYWLIREAELRRGDYIMFMRRPVDEEIAAADIKRMNAKTILETYEVVAAYDDSLEACEAYRELGIPAHRFQLGSKYEMPSLELALGIDVEPIDIDWDESEQLRIIRPDRPYLRAPEAADESQGVAPAASEKAEEGPKEAVQTPSIVRVVPTVQVSLDELPNSSKILLVDLGVVADESWRAGAIAKDKSNPDYYPNVVNDRVFPALVPLIAEAIRRGVYVIFSTDRPSESIDWTVKWVSEKFKDYGDAQFSVVSQRECGHAGYSARIASLYAVVAKANEAGMRILAVIDGSIEVRDAAMDIGLFALRSNGRETYPGPIGGPSGGLAMGPQDIVGYILPPDGEPMEGNEELESARLPRDHWPFSEAEGVGDPIQDGATENDGLSESQIAIIDNLEGAAATFRDRAKVYGENDKAISEIMEILFPNGITLSTENDFRMFHFMNHVVGKLTRFAGSGMKDRDSIHDLITYSAFCERECEFHEIRPVKG